MNKQDKKVLKIGGIIIALILTTSAGIMAYSYYQPKPMPAPQLEVIVEQADLPIQEVEPIEKADVEPILKSTPEVEPTVEQEKETTVEQPTDVISDQPSTSTQADTTTTTTTTIKEEIAEDGTVNLTPEYPVAKPDDDDAPKDGDKKDGMEYWEGFGWVKDEGGGGAGTVIEIDSLGKVIGY